MKMNSRIALAIAAVAALSATGFVFASLLRGGASLHRPHPIGFLDRLVNDPSLQSLLVLQPDQVVRLGRIRAEASEGLSRLRAEVLARRLEMRALMEEAGTTRRSLEEKAEAIARARLAVGHEALRAILDARDVLTPEQRTKLRQAVRRRWMRDRDGGQPGGGDSGQFDDDGALTENAG